MADSDEWKKKYKFDESQVKHFWETYPDEAKYHFKEHKEWCEKLRRNGKLSKWNDFESDEELRYIVTDHLKRKYSLSEKEVKYYWETYTAEAKELFENFKKISAHLRERGETPKDYFVESDNNIKHRIAKMLKDKEEISSRMRFDAIFKGGIIKEEDPKKSKDLIDRIIDFL